MDSLQRSAALPEETSGYADRDFQIRVIDAVPKIRVQALRRRGSQDPAADASKLPLSRTDTGPLEPLVLWRAPDDWLLVSFRQSAQALCDWAAEVTHSAPLLLTDISSSMVVFELQGARALEVLMRDCTLDLEGNEVPPDTCAQTELAQARVMIFRLAVGESWVLFVERSVARHVWDWLVDSAGASSAEGSNRATAVRT